MYNAKLSENYLSLRWRLNENLKPKSSLPSDPVALVEKLQKSTYRNRIYKRSFQYVKLPRRKHLCIRLMKNLNEKVTFSQIFIIMAHWALTLPLKYYYSTVISKKNTMLFK